MGQVGRPPSCTCGECQKCKHRLYMREWYRKRSKKERSAWVAKRDRKKVRAADRHRYYRDWKKRRDAMDKWHAENPNKVIEHKRKSRKKYPEKYAARTAAGNAVRDGRLIKRPCEVCGEIEVHAHHDDYAKPLEVRWLCPKHHGEIHRQYPTEEVS